MKPPEGNPEALLPLSPASFHILVAVTDEEKHGYAIMQEVEQKTDGKVRLSPGTLYRTVKQLLDNRMIEESQNRPAAELDDERRRYYRLTIWGQRVLAAETARLANLVRLAQGHRLLEGFENS